MKMEMEMKNANESPIKIKIKIDSLFKFICLLTLIAKHSSTIQCNFKHILPNNSNHHQNPSYARKSTHHPCDYQC